MRGDKTLHWQKLSSQDAIVSQLSL